MKNIWPVEIQHEWKTLALFAGFICIFININILMKYLIGSASIATGA